MINNSLTQSDIVKGLRNIGLKEGDVVLVHSAMRTLGPIDGGAETVVKAFLEVIGEKGTLVAPAFTFIHEAGENPLVDPASDPSEMGIISETIRTWPEARRSAAYRHSFAAVGRRAEVITNVDPALSPFDLRASFGVMLALDTQVVMLGMTYASSTSHHFAEAVCEVPYRYFVPKKARLRKPDGSVVDIIFTDYQPKPPVKHTDFNRLGRMLEDEGLADAVPIGNAAVRRYAMRDLINHALAANDPEVFRMPEGRTELTPLALGNIVLSPEIMNSKGKMQRYFWCVMDPEKIAGLGKK